LTLLCNSSELEDWACNRQEKDSNSADMGQQASVTKVSGHAFYFRVGVSKKAVGEKLWEVVKVVDGGCCRFKIAVEAV